MTTSTTRGARSAFWLATTVLFCSITAGFAVGITAAFAVLSVASCFALLASVASDLD